MNGRMGPILFGPHVMEKTLNEGSGPTLVWASCGPGAHYIWALHGHKARVVCAEKRRGSC